MFYRFDQSFNHGYLLQPAHLLYIQASTIQEAIDIALTVPGVYHDPHRLFDCKCCRFERWPMFGPWLPAQKALDDMRGRLKYYCPDWEPLGIDLAIVKFKIGKDFVVKTLADVDAVEKFIFKLKNDMFPEI